MESPLPDEERDSDGNVKNVKVRKTPPFEEYLPLRPQVFIYLFGTKTNRKAKHKALNLHLGTGEPPGNIRALRSPLLGPTVVV